MAMKPRAAGTQRDEAKFISQLYH